MRFEWDAAKARQNEPRHGVSFAVASTVFGDPLSLSFRDDDHSASEQRFLIVGVAEDGRPLIVSYTDEDDRIRLISARALTRAERHAYEEETSGRR